MGRGTQTSQAATEIPVCCSQSSVCSLLWQQKEALNRLETQWDLIVSLQFSSFVALGTAKMLQDGKVTDHIPLPGVSQALNV